MKKLISVIAAAAVGMSILAGCSSTTQKTAETAAQATAAETAAAQVTAAETSAAQTAASETSAAQTAASETSAVQTAASETSAASGTSSDTVIRVTGLKGPTTMGLVKLMDDAANGTSKNSYEFTMVTAADELTAMIAGGKTDIALLPANVASVLYNKTKGGVTVIDINTLGVLYLVSSDTSVSSIEQLKGRTVYLTGKGTTPEYALRYLLSAAGLEEQDVTLEFKSEASEVASVLAENPEYIGLLPQPFVTSALAQNDKLSIIMDLTQIWDEFQKDGGSRMVTGVTIANTQFLKEHADLVNTFLEEHQASIGFAAEDPDTTAALIEAAGIIPKAAVAKKALPYCNLSFLSGEDMKAALSGYLQVLFDQNPASVGGTLPEEAFYYIQ